jgi:isoquinoline 1-oxidoreductase beta subunit
VYPCDRIFGKYTYQGIGVVATNYWAALQGRRALKVIWDNGANASFNSKEFEQLLRNVSKKDGLPNKPVGDFDKAFASAPVNMEAFYETPFVSHSPIEPMNCLAHWHDNNKLDVWASTQVPGSLVDEVSKHYGIPPENLKLTTSFVGGGFGRRLLNDFVYEAVDLSKKTGKPVKIIWTREDDTKQGPFRPPTFSAMRAGLGSDGKPVAFQHKVISSAIDFSMNKDYDRTKVDDTMVEGISEQKYEIPNMRNAFVFVDCDIPVFAWRAVTSTTLAFSHESFIDEMAVKANKDPMQYRLDMMTKDSDAKNVLLKLKEVSNWDKPLPAGWGRGVAQYQFFAGLCGNVVIVSKKDKGIKIEKIYSVIDMGTVVNPDTVKGQVEGAVVMALTAAIKGGITFNKGQTVQSNFNDNPIIRINEIPAVEVHILANGGSGIKGLVSRALPPRLLATHPTATGKRIRRLPLTLRI